ncbi:MAG: serine hydroxymethyltransferase, partial [Nitrospirota bacterium]|nr:serine hydroxymethyltransferase [Nitrospirota bacterium]
PGIQGGPLVHTIAAKAVALKEALTQEFKDYQVQVIKNAKRLAETLLDNGFTIVSGGTDNHMMLVDLTNKGTTGRDAERALEFAGITVNKNVIPYDERSPAVTSGIRLGTPCVTTRGMGETEMIEIADIISSVIQNINDVKVTENFSKKVRSLCNAFPIYEEQSVKI